ncbi:hypothetical protein K1719_040108 [Acacia pycnantha]|nr:hypothetical protein K1719_040108 [Acacia pycnantha]
MVSETGAASAPISGRSGIDVGGDLLGCALLGLGLPGFYPIHPMCNKWKYITDQIEVDKEPPDMLNTLGMNEIPGIVQVDPVPVQKSFGFGHGGLGGAGRRF